jgi:hypothetical protein
MNSSVLILEILVLVESGKMMRVREKGVHSVHNNKLTYKVHGPIMWRSHTWVAWVELFYKAMSFCE